MSTIRHVKSAQERAIFCRRDADRYAESLGDKFKAQCLAEWRKAMAVCRLHLAPTRRRAAWH